MYMFEQVKTKCKTKKTQVAKGKKIRVFENEATRTQPFIPLISLVIERNKKHR